MIIEVYVTDNNGECVFFDAICKIPFLDLKGENGGYPSLAEVARVIARRGHPMEIFKDAQAALLAAQEEQCRISTSA